MIKWINFYVGSKFARNTDGHLPADDLKNKINSNNGDEAYHCAFDLDETELNYEIDTGEKVNNETTYRYSKDPTLKTGEKLIGKTFKSYTGIARPALNLLQFDFDSSDLGESLRDVRSFLSWLDLGSYSVAFSGSKGFHVAIPFGYTGLKPNGDLPRTLRKLAEELKPHFPTLDTSVYSVNQKFRALNSRHPKTGLYKRLVTNGFMNNEVPDEKMVEITIRKAKERGENYIDTLFEPVEPARVLTDILDKISVTSYEVTPVGETSESLEKYALEKDKKCIKRLLEDRAPEGQRNEIAMRLVDDFFKTLTHRPVAEKALRKWAKENDFPTQEMDGIIHRVFSGQESYNYGCQDPLKYARCDYNCSIRKTLDPDKRPPVLNTPKSAMKDEKERVPESEVVANILIDNYNCKTNGDFYSGGNLVKQEGDLFRYDDKKWVHLNRDDLDIIKVKIASSYKHEVSFGKIDSTFKNLMAHVPPKPKDADLFSPPIDKAGFKNGTLEKTRVNNIDTIIFREHRREDYLTNIIDINYSQDSGDYNERFMELLHNVFIDDNDRDEKIKCIQQCFGAALMPAYPHIFFLYGVPQSGKSTIMFILKYLLGEEDNLSHVPPNEFGNFDMETMANKLVNMVTDIDHNAKTKNDVFKQIEDRQRVRIKRKGIKDLVARIPAVHIFGGNALPKLFQEANTSMDRRVSVVKFNTSYKGKRNREIAREIFDSNPTGILNFARDGLRQLIENGGDFINPSSGIEEVIAWGMNGDPLAMFFDDFNREIISYIDRRGGVKELIYTGKDTDKIIRGELFQFFRDWSIAMGCRDVSIAPGDFYNRCKDLGFKVHARRKDGRYALGFKIGDTYLESDRGSDRSDSAGCHPPSN